MLFIFIFFVWILFLVPSNEFSGSCVRDNVCFFPALRWRSLLFTSFESQFIASVYCSLSLFVARWSQIVGVEICVRHGRAHWVAQSRLPKYALRSRNSDWSSLAMPTYHWKSCSGRPDGLPWTTIVCHNATDTSKGWSRPYNHQTRYHLYVNLRMGYGSSPWSMPYNARRL